VQFRGEEDEARIGRPPQDGFAGIIPGKDAVFICQDEAFGAEIAAHGKEALLGGQVGGREGEFMGEAENRHSGGYKKSAAGYICPAALFGLREINIR
jgi:hypothetical protein